MLDERQWKTRFLEDNRQTYAYHKHHKTQLKCHKLQIVYRQRTLCLFLLELAVLILLVLKKKNCVEISNLAVLREHFVA